MDRLWIFLINPFLTATAESYRRMKKLGDFSVAALAAHPGAPFTTLLAALSPLSTAFNDAYAAWITQMGTQKSKTSTLTSLLKTLRSEKAGDWDIAIQGIYKDGTERYIELLPRKRAAFQDGSQEDRINAIKSLLLAIGSDASLATLKTEIDAFYTQIKTAFSTQKGSKSVTNTNSTAVEAARIALCTEMYSVLGLLMSNFKNTPEAVGDFFDLQTLRSLEQEIFKSDIAAAETRLVLTHTFEAGEQLRIINRGNANIGFAKVKEKNDPLPTEFVTIKANDEAIIAIADLGDLSNRFLIAKNLSDTISSAYTVEML